jgi:hypothetical protein
MDSAVSDSLACEGAAVPIAITQPKTAVVIVVLNVAFLMMRPPSLMFLKGHRTTDVSGIADRSM